VPGVPGSLARASFALLLPLAACGARTEIDGPGVVGRDAAPRDAAVPETGVADTGFPEASFPDASVPQMSYCAVGAGGSASPVAAVNAGGVVSFVDQAGNVTTPYTFPAALAQESRIYVDIVSRGDYVAAVAGDLPTTPGGGTTLSVALLRTDGHLLWSGSFTETIETCGQTPGLVGNADGLFVTSVWGCDQNLGVTFSPAGGTRWVAPYNVVGDPDPSGALVVLNDEGGSTEDFYWFDTNTQTFSPTIYYEVPGPSAAFYGPWLVYPTVAAQDGGPPSPHMWLETPHGRSLLPSGGDAWGDSYVYGLVTESSSSWAIATWGVGNTSLAQVFRVSPAGSPSPVLTLTPPPGTTLWNAVGDVSLGDNPTVDDDGNLFALFAPSSGGAQAYRMVGGQWQAVGEIMGGIASANLLEAGGTYVAAGTTLPEGPFEGPDGGSGVLVGDHVQVLRPATAASMTLPLSDWTNQTYPAYFVTQDGGCIAYFEGGFLTLADARTGTVHATTLMADVANQAVAWTNVPGDGQLYFSPVY
jgi:hypothetical protein